MPPNLNIEESTVKATLMNQPLPPAASAKSFIIINFGANEMMYLNPTCLSVNFLNVLRSRLASAGYHIDSRVVDTLDLCTLKGEVMGLRKLSPYEYIAAHIADRETYVPVAVDAKRQKGDIQDSRAPFFAPIMSEKSDHYRQITDGLRRTRLVLSRRVADQQAASGRTRDPAGRSKKGLSGRWGRALAASSDGKGRK